MSLDGLLEPTLRRPNSFRAKQESLAFVRKEFFSLKMGAFDAFCDFYETRYGKGAKQYLVVTYPLWRSGAKRVSAQTERRILECVPPFLSIDKQFELLCFQVPSVLDQQAGNLRKQFGLFSITQTSQIETLYRNVAQSIARQDYELDWFVKASFSDRSIKEFVEVLRHAALCKVRLEYSQVVEDLKCLNASLSACAGNLKSTYRLDSLPSELIFDGIPHSAPYWLQDELLAEPRLVSHFRDKFKRVIIDYAIERRGQEVGGRAKIETALGDLRNLTDFSSRVKDGKMELEARGQQGLFQVSLHKRDCSAKKVLILLESIKFFVFMSIACGAFGALCLYGGSWLCIKVVFVSSALALWPFARLKELTSEVERYEQRRKS